MLVKTKKVSNSQIQTGYYPNGQLAVFLNNPYDGPIAELSLSKGSVELSEGEFILKNYSENQSIVQELLDSGVIIPVSRFVLVGPYLCPICRLND